MEGPLTNLVLSMMRFEAPRQRRPRREEYDDRGPGMGGGDKYDSRYDPRYGPGGPMPPGPGGGPGGYGGPGGGMGMPGMDMMNPGLPPPQFAMDGSQGGGYSQDGSQGGMTGSHGSFSQDQSDRLSFASGAFWGPSENRPSIVTS